MFPLSPTIRTLSSTSPHIVCVWCLRSALYLTLHLPLSTVLMMGVCGALGVLCTLSSTSPYPQCADDGCMWCLCGELHLKETRPAAGHGELELCSSSLNTVLCKLVGTASKNELKCTTTLVVSRKNAPIRSAHTVVAYQQDIFAFHI